MLTLSAAVAATKGRAIHADRFPAELKVVTDSRTLQAGEVFLALRGERFDGHAYVPQAVASGAAAVVVEDAASVPEGVPALVVAQTTQAYMALAGAVRAQYHGTVIAITGSAGKTTTRHLLGELLKAHYGAERVLASHANENNEIGVSKLLLRADPAHEVIVVEMGARHEGEIADLVRVARPHVGILTNIGDAHLELFGSREALAKTKWGLFSEGAQAVLNARDEKSVALATSLGTPPLWFGTGKPDRPGVWIDGPVLRLNYAVPQRDLPIDLQIRGEHNHANAAAAVAAALLLGIPPQVIVPLLPRLTLPAGRYQAISVNGRPRLIYDAYNASPAGMIAALNAFAGEQGKRRIAILSSMAELGAESSQMHERVGAHAAASGIDVLLAGGEFASSLEAGALKAGLTPEQIVVFANNAQACAWLREHADPQDVVLLKGSRAYKLEEIVQELFGE